ncbi:MAG: GerAB/ArcD/ProY family transporter [Sulfobacillus thermotolerans]|uniref:Uncharacterized protein n=1 Tax=Sulfobacillus thermotolerans TaxID=338644 RepID=A0ABN5GWM5_9FIRM|nr:hypothetical protein BXT84_01740 [Sulfobacillus thermotolerans]MCY0907313.1 GerAB/ArcD/ProY family transporter [Sulfobacillus thermotolerans]
MSRFVESTVEPIGSLEYFFLVASSIVTGAVYIWPQALMTAAQSQSDWAVVGSICLALGMTGLGLIWIQLTPPGILVDRLGYAWGPLRWILLLIHAVLCLVLDTAVLTLFTQMLAASFYPATPLWIMKGLIIAEAAWFASRSLSNFARNVQFWFPVFAFTFFILAGMGLGHVEAWWAFLPHALKDTGPVGQGIVATWFLWKQNEVTATLSHFIRPQNIVMIRRVTLGAIAFQTLVVILVYLITVGTLGPQAVILLRWPLVYVLSNLNVSTFYLSRPGLIILLLWTGSMVFYLASNLFCMGINFSRLITGSYKSTMPTTLIIAIIMMVGSCFIDTPTQSTHLVVDFFDPIDLGYSFVVISLSILLTLIVTSWRRHHPKSPPA